MKTYWSAFLSLFVLATLSGCGNEQFGTGGQSSNSTANPLTSYSHQSCSAFTLIKPKVDVVYVVDNSSSTYYVPNDIKVSIRNTVNSLSTDFDYRIIGTPLIATANGNDEYQVMTNSSNMNGILAPKVVQTAGDLNFFTKPGLNSGGFEQGFDRVHSFITAHKGSLIRNDAHTIIVLVSNGRDNDVERFIGYEQYYPSNYTNWLQRIKLLKNAGYQLRFASVTAHTPISQCPNNGQGYASSMRSYVQMSKDIYSYTKGLEGASDQDGSQTPDSYNLCSSAIGSLFSSVNSSIKQVLIAHGYRHWPIAFANNNPVVSLDDVKVTKISANGTKTSLIKDVDWTYRSDIVTTMNIDLRETPTPGEPYSGRHFIRFTELLNYPDCVLVTSVSQTEYYNYVVLPRKPLLPVTVKVNGVEIPQSALDTSAVGTSMTTNIKFSPSTTPPVMKTGFMIRITNSNYYYKSGDNVETLFTPAGI